MYMILFVAVLSIGFGVEFFFGPQRVISPTAYEQAREEAVAHHFISFQRALDRFISADPRNRLAQLAQYASISSDSPSWGSTNPNLNLTSHGVASLLQNAGLLPQNFFHAPMFQNGGPPWGVVVGPEPANGSGQRLVYIHTGSLASLPTRTRVNPEQFVHHIKQRLEGGHAVGVVQNGHIVAFGAQGTNTEAQLQHTISYQGYDRNALLGQAVQIFTPGIPEGSVVLVRGFSVDYNTTN